MAKPNLDESEQKIYELDKCEKLMDKYGVETKDEVKAEKDAEKDKKEKIK